MEFISNEVRAEKFIFEQAEGDYKKEWKIEEYELQIAIKTL